MKYRRLGQAGIKVSELSLGGWTTFGDSLTDTRLAREIITTAYDNGINFFDIADMYGKGEAEHLMGSVLKLFPRHTLVISSKAYWPMSDDVNDRGLSRKHVMESVEGSLQRIGTDYLDLFFCHRYDEETPLEETIRAIDDLIHQGKVLYWGTSEWTGEQIQAALDLCDEHGLYKPVVEQPEYHMFHRQRVEGDVLPVTEPGGMGLVVWSPLASGLLTGKYDDGLPEGSRLNRLSWIKDWQMSERRVEAVRQLKPIADELGATRAQLAIAWTLRKSGVSSAITGATKVSQIEDTLQAVEIELSDDMIERIDAIIAPVAE